MSPPPLPPPPVNSCHFVNEKYVVEQRTHAEIEKWCAWIWGIFGKADGLAGRGWFAVAHAVCRTSGLRQKQRVFSYEIEQIVFLVSQSYACVIRLSFPWRRILEVAD